MATNTIKRGSIYPYEQRVVFDYDPARGIIYDYDFDGAGQPEMQAIFNDYVAQGIACRMVFEKDKATLQAQDSTNSVTLDTWQILGNVESPDGLSHPTVLQICTDDQVAAIRSGIEAVTAATPIKTQISAILAGSSFSGLSAGQKEILTRFIGLQLRGSKEYRKPEYVLRHTTNAPSNNTQNIADVGINNIYTPAQLLSEAQDSGLWLFPIPPYLSYKIANIPVPTFKANYLWGWLKSPSTSSTAANNRIDISTEFTLAQWSTDYYDAY